MRLIRTSDWHLGWSLHGESLLGHQESFPGWLLEQAVSHQVDGVVVAGDVYDRAVPGTDAVSLLVRHGDDHQRPMALGVDGRFSRIWCRVSKGTIRGWLGWVVRCR